MRFRVENLGPLREAEVDLGKDLIVLTGPNNTGKTYLAWSVYGLFRTRDGFLADSFAPAAEKILGSPQLRVDARELWPCWQEYMSRLAARCREELPRCFAAHPDRFASTRIHLTMSEGPRSTDKLVSWSKRLLVPFQDQSVFSLSLRFEDTGFIVADIDEPVTSLSGQQALQAMPLQGQGRAQRSLSKLLRRMSEEFFFPPTYIFPAERIAVNIFARELALKRTELVDEVLDDVGPDSDVPSPREMIARRAGRYPWPIRDSLRYANELPVLARDSTQFTDLADDIEHGVLGGTVSVSADGEPTFAPAAVPDRTLAIHLTASVVKSLSSLVFYFRHMAEPGDFLIIDEPELNLHPDNQRKVTRILAKAVNRGFKIMMSTHSDYVLRELNHLVMLSDPKPSVSKVIDDLGYDRASILSPDKLGVYLFKDNTAHPVPVDVDGFEIETIEREIVALNADAQAIYAARFG
jgi:hypothetical protein